MILILEDKYKCQYTPKSGKIKVLNAVRMRINLVMEHFARRI